MCVCVCVIAQWEHDESVQLGGFRSGGGEGPHPILIGLRHPEGGANNFNWMGCHLIQMTGDSCTFPVVGSTFLVYD